MKPHNNTLKSQPTVGVYNDINVTGRFKLNIEEHQINCKQKTYSQYTCKRLHSNELPLYIRKSEDNNCNKFITKNQLTVTKYKKQTIGMKIPQYNTAHNCLKSSFSLKKNTT
ncbi:hypothetical protein NP493_1035g00002 [Ridgeia piscesae]|uniref:Uncharacterized protein n=1 Tax=Ridgeia piscesae TaxID=27915 RepID=A0AAD9KJ80_RIDPI|nr:hypothetical protein NP493_1035g00002 [Ridgeia piscesae]